MASFDGNKLSGFKEKVEEMKTYYDKDGIPGLERQLKKQLNEWENVHIKIAVIGRSGAGKSSFINSIRGITADDPGAAEVDVTECTTSVQEYLYPGNKNVRIYDFPGLGTPHVEQSTHLADDDFKQYDFFIIITESRFMNEDLWLVQKVEENGKPFYFVRSKIDNDVRSHKKAHPRTHNQTAVLKGIKEEIEANLKRFSRKDIFFINNYKTHLYDFGRLTFKLIEDATEIKRDALSLSLRCLSNEVIREKKRILKRKIPWITFLAIISNEPSPLGLKYGSFKSLLVSEEVKLYRKLFQVDTKSVTDGKEVCDLSEDERKNVNDKKTSHYNAEYQILSQSLLDIFTLIPMAGNLAGGLKCANFLEKNLDETADLATEIHGLMIGGLARKVTP